MKNKILVAAVLCLAVIALVRSFGKPVLAQVRAALVQNVDEPGRNAFAFYQNNSTLNPYFAQFSVPAGKRYVIQQYKAECDIVSTTSMSDVQVISTVGGNTSNASAPAHVVQFNGNISGQQVYAYAGTGLGPVYADPGTSVTVFASAVAGTGYTTIKDCNFWISGYSVTP